MNASPADFLFAVQAAQPTLPVCDHYCGVEERIVKSIALQSQLHAEFGCCVFDVTLDCEDGAPVGKEAEHAQMVADLILQAPANARLALRVHALGHPAFAGDVQTIVSRAAARLSHIMLPKVERREDIDAALAVIDATIEGAGGNAVTPRPLPVHALIESSQAVSQAFHIAAHPRVASLSFGLMDFVSSHAGAIPESAMDAEGQFSHPLVRRAKLEIAAACHAYGKVPSHSVVTEFNDDEKLRAAAERASQEFGYTRMWSIHPKQIRPILEAFSPSLAALDKAVEILSAAQQARWAPISHQGVLHDRASYRYYAQLLARAENTGSLQKNKHASALLATIKSFQETPI